MLIEGLYHIEKTEATGDSCTNYIVRLNAGHAVFEGHFPGRPILPGVAMVQMVHELAERQTGQKLRLVQAKKIKFLSAVNPGDGTELLIKLTVTGKEESYNADASAVFMNQPCFKINAQYHIE